MIRKRLIRRLDMYCLELNFISLTKRFEAALIMKFGILYKHIKGSSKV